MKYEKTITIDSKTAAFYEKVLMSTDMMGEDDTYIVTAEFENGMEMDIKICGCDNGEPWTEGVLFNKNSSEVAYTEPSEEFFGEWCFEYNNDIYVVNIVKANSCKNQ